MQDNGFITSSTHFSLLQIPARSSQCRHHLNHREGSTPLLSSCKLLPVLHLHDVGLGEGSQRREGYTSPQYALTAWLQVTSQLLRNWAEGTSRSLCLFFTGKINNQHPSLTNISWWDLVMLPAAQLSSLPLCWACSCCRKCWGHRAATACSYQSLTLCITLATNSSLPSHLPRLT